MKTLTTYEMDHVSGGASCIANMATSSITWGLFSMLGYGLLQSTSATPQPMSVMLALPAFKYGATLGLISSATGYIVNFTDMLISVGLSSKPVSATGK